MLLQKYDFLSYFQILPIFQSVYFHAVYPVKQACHNHADNVVRQEPADVYGGQCVNGGNNAEYLRNGQFNGQQRGAETAAHYHK